METCIINQIIRNVIYLRNKELHDDLKQYFKNRRFIPVHFFSSNNAPICLPLSAIPYGDTRIGFSSEVLNQLKTLRLIPNDL